MPCEMRVAETIGEEVPRRKPVEQNPEEGGHFHEQRKREAREEGGKNGRWENWEILVSKEPREI